MIKLSCLLTITLFFVACSSSSDTDNDSGKNSSNSNNPREDAGNDTKNETPETSVKDTGVDVGEDHSVLPDNGPVPPKQLSCVEVMGCIQSCSDETCGQDCYLQANTTEQGKVDAMGQCLQAAEVGSCATDCANKAACDACTNEACATEVNACMGGTGSPEEGFGDPCDAEDLECKTGFICIGLAGGTPGKGFCTKECVAPGLPCVGAPIGTTSRCVLEAPTTGTGFLCTFLCDMGGKTFDCPSALTCDPNDPGSSGIKGCLPI